MDTGLIEEVYEAKKSAMKYNLCSIFRNMFWSLILEEEKKTGKIIFQKHLDNIIRTIVDTSCYPNNKDYGNWPRYDAESIEESFEYVSKILKEKGIKSHSKI